LYNTILFIETLWIFCSGLILDIGKHYDWLPDIYLECIDGGNEWHEKAGHWYGKIYKLSIIGFILLPAIQVEQVFYSVPKKYGYFGNLKDGQEPVGFEK